MGSGDYNPFTTDHVLHKLCKVCHLPFTTVSRKQVYCTEGCKDKGVTDIWKKSRAKRGRGSSRRKK